MKDPYKVLGVDRKASSDEIKTAYRKLAKQHHPDLNPGDDRVERQFKEISQAYSILGDKEKRQRFDRGEIDAGGQDRGPGGRYRQSWGSAQPGQRGSFGFGQDVNVDDFFSDLFSTRRSRGRKIRQPGSNVTYKASVSFLDAANGAKRRVTLTDGKSLEIAIPPGTEDGQSLRLKGQGMAGLGGAASGDAYVEIAVEPHAFFSRQGRDIQLELPVTLQEAILGARITVPTVHGQVTMKIPRGSNSGTALRLKGKGIAAPGSGKAGDQLVRLKVVLPDKIDKELEDFVRSWGAKRGYDPRGKAGLT